MSGNYALYLAVLPAYRAQCVEVLLECNDHVKLYASDAHLDRSVRTGIAGHMYQRVRMLRVGPLFIQVGGWRDAWRSDGLVVDLNPRSVTAWGLLILRRLGGKHTVTWGHLSPRSGRDSPTRHLRKAMRRLSRGFVAYTPGQAQSARLEIPDQPAWVASNALYTRSQLLRPWLAKERTNAIYVGRLEAEKRVHLLVQAFALFVRSDDKDVRLTIVGDGDQREALEAECMRLGIENRVDFHGWVYDFDNLASLYASSFTSVSPGFAGLGLTQSLGFGVPQIVADDQPHSPEIELADTPGAVHWFQGESIESLHSTLDLTYANRNSVPLDNLQIHIATFYTAEAMAEGLLASVMNRRI
ncbi:MAG: glycosyltransferase [Nocardioides sp.]|nr:glycosyltransferase [Nocardioides sp.]